jgi:cytoskeletal protein CcmA (bactofilin family)
MHPGDVVADDLVIESGAILNGKISMKQIEEAPAGATRKILKKKWRFLK